MIPDECMQVYLSLLLLNHFHLIEFLVMLRNFAAVTSELRGRWLSNKRSREEINVARWDQLKNLLQSNKQKVAILY